MPKLFIFNSKIVILDEPTSALTNEDKERLFKIIRNLKEKGIGIIYISHRLEELFEIGDRVTVLRGRSLCFNSSDFRSYYRFSHTNDGGP